MVAYPDSDRELETSAREIAAVLKAASIATTILPASKVVPTAMLSATLYFFGVGDAADPAWGELRRLLSGINLAGRRVFAWSRDGQAATFLGYFADTEARTASRSGLPGAADWAGSSLRS